jgi:DNA modification methylase
MNQAITDYQSFLESKRIVSTPSGFRIEQKKLNPLLMGWQKLIVEWQLIRGKGAIFGDCGLGKTPMQLEWSHQVHKKTKGDVLLLAPLAVSAQTQREGLKFNIKTHVVANRAEVKRGINITNYEKLHHFKPDDFAAIVLDESSILKAFGGTVRKEITDFASSIPFRLACTATPAPNDLIEITNHAEFLGVMNGKEIIALFFTQDGNTTHKWRLKGHAKKDFWKWLASWAIAIRKPSDLGFNDGDFILPQLRTHQITVESTGARETLFAVDAVTLDDQRRARRNSLNDRVQTVAEMVNASSEAWVIWCDLNSESEALRRSIPDAVEVKGSDSPEHKEKAAIDFADGKVRVIISKPSIFGFGMNWQHCHKAAFVGLSHSWESYYQAVRRIWRFGQKNIVDAYIVTSEEEGAVVANIERKERQATEMMEELVKHMSEIHLEQQTRDEMAYREDVAHGEGWTLYLGDSIERLDKIESDSVGLTITSPPFPGMYAYTNSAHDIGNCKNIETLMAHFEFMMPKLLRVTMPGRSCALHITQQVAFKGTDGFIGLRDFRGKLIEAMQKAGWIYYGEVLIDKNPQLKAVRTKDAGLQFKSLANDAARMHMGLGDYLLQFRKPGENPKPIRAGISQKYKSLDGWITNDEWIEWAAPVWYGEFRGLPGGIRESDVLNVAAARDGNDERHLCPLQLGVIERAVKLWSAPSDIVLDPFNGIGSTGYTALKLNRQYIGIELKESYWKSSIRNLERGLQERAQQNLFSSLEAVGA